MTTHDHPGFGRRIRRGIEAGKQKYSGSPADVLWRRLNSVDFLNQGMVFVGTLPMTGQTFSANTILVTLRTQCYDLLRNRSFRES